MKTIVTGLQTRLLRALIRTLSLETNRTASLDFTRELPCIVVESITSTEWASLTFAGARHKVRLRLAKPCADETKLVDRLVASNLQLAGHIVAEVKVVACNAVWEQLHLTIEVLTIVDESELSF